MAHPKYSPRRPRRHAALDFGPTLPYGAWRDRLRNEGGSTRAYRPGKPYRWHRVEYSWPRSEYGYIDVDCLNSCGWVEYDVEVRFDKHSNYRPEDYARIRAILYYHWQDCPEKELWSL